MFRVPPAGCVVCVLHIPAFRLVSERMSDEAAALLQRPAYMDVSVGERHHWGGEARPIPFKTRTGQLERPREWLHPARDGCLRNATSACGCKPENGRMPKASASKVPTRCAASLARLTAPRLYLPTGGGTHGTGTRVVAGGHRGAGAQS
jgi:hypothetical protein